MKVQGSQRGKTKELSSEAFMSLPRKVAARRKIWIVAVVLCCALASSGPRELAADTVHLVEAGDTLGGIAMQHLGYAQLWPVLAAYASLKDPHRLRVGLGLPIPESLEALAEPFLSDGEEAWVVPDADGLRQRADFQAVVLGFVVRREDEKRFLAIELEAGAATVFFDSTAVEEPLEELGVSLEWILDDLDGDGGIDVVAVAEQGRVLNTSIFAWAETSEGFRRFDLLPWNRSISIGEVLRQRQPDGRRRFIIHHRDGDAGPTTLNWPGSDTLPAPRPN